MILVKHVCLLEHATKFCGIVFPVGTGKDQTIRDLAEAVARATGFSGHIYWDTLKPDGTPKKQLDVSRLTSLGWSASIDLPSGLARMVDEFREELNYNRIRL